MVGVVKAPAGSICVSRVPGDTGSKLSTKVSVPNSGSSLVCAKLDVALDELDDAIEDAALLRLDETLDATDVLELDELTTELELLLELLRVTTVPLAYCSIQS